MRTRGAATHIAGSATSFTRPSSSSSFLCSASTCSHWDGAGRATSTCQRRTAPAPPAAQHSTARHRRPSPSALGHFLCRGGHLPGQGFPSVSAIAMAEQGPTAAPSFLQSSPQHWDDTSPTTGTSSLGCTLESSFLVVGPVTVADKVPWTLVWMFPSRCGSLVSPQLPSPM